MCPAWLVPAAITAGSGILSSLLGKDETMSPEQRKVFDLLMAEYNKGASGFSTAEKGGMISNLKSNLAEREQSDFGNIQSSLSRRNMLSPGLMTGASTELKAGYGKAYGQGINDINLASAEQARQQRTGQLGILQSLAGMAPGPDKSGAPGLSGLLANLMLLLKKKQGTVGEGSPLGDYNTGGEVYG